MIDLLIDRPCRTLGFVVKNTSKSLAAFSSDPPIELANVIGPLENSIGVLLCGISASPWFAIVMGLVDPERRRLS
jgi:hypothetical protein